MKVKDLLTDESKWIKGADAKNKSGRPRLASSEEAVCWCFSGALQKCYVHNKYPEYLRITRLLYLRIGSITEWNDAPERTFAEVKALIEELDI